MLTYFLGLGTTIFGLLFVILMIVTSIKFFRRKVFDIQIALLLLSSMLLSLVIQLENLLFLNGYTNLIDYVFPKSVLILSFCLGLVGYFVYHIHLLTIEDFPTGPLSLVLLIGGFATGSFLLSIRIDYSTPLNPIGYDPLIGGIFFLSSMILFSILGVIGFLRSLFLKPFMDAYSKISPLDFFGLIGIANTPFIMYLLRIITTYSPIFPFNFIFITTIFGYICHFVQYLKNPEGSGYPLHANLVNLMIMDTEKQTVLSGYSIIDLDETKLHAMAALAVDNLIEQILGEENLSTKPRYLGNFADILFIQEGKLILLASFHGLGKTTGQLLLSLLLRAYNTKYKIGEQINFEQLVDAYIFPFVHKKTTHNQFYTLGTNLEVIPETDQ